MNYRIYILFLLNVLIVMVILFEMIQTKNSDSIGAYFIVSIFFALIINIYAIFLNFIFIKLKLSGLLSDFIFLVLILMPILVLWYITS